jgi:hypothetical protein
MLARRQLYRRLENPFKKLSSETLKTCRKMAPLLDRVARWYIFKPNIPIWVYFGGLKNGKCWFILCAFGIFDSHLVYLVAIGYILWPLGTFCGRLVYFSPVWYIVSPFCFANKNLATLLLERSQLKHVTRFSSRYRLIARDN